METILRFEDNYLDCCFLSVISVCVLCVCVKCVVNITSIDNSVFLFTKKSNKKKGTIVEI